MFGEAAYLRDDEGEGHYRNWAPGKGMALNDNIHNGFKDISGLCYCGRHFRDVNAWQNHVDEEAARDILINHGRNEKGDCFVCGKLSEALSEHILAMFYKAGLHVVRIMDSD